MTPELITALKNDIQTALKRRWEQDNSGEYVPMKIYEYMLPPRKASGEKESSLVIMPTDGEDTPDDEKIKVDIGICIYRSMPVRTQNDDENETALYEHLADGSATVVNLLSVVQKIIRNTPLVGGRYRYTGKLTWAVFDNVSQPSPYFYARITPTYESMIINKMKTEEAMIYGSYLE